MDPKRIDPTPLTSDRHLKDEIRDALSRLSPDQAGAILNGLEAGQLGLADFLALLRDRSEPSPVAVQPAVFNWIEYEAARKAFFASLLDSESFGYWCVDFRSGRGVVCDRCAAMTGIASRTHAFSPQVIERIHPDDFDRVNQACLQLYRGETDRALFRYRLLFPDGSSRWVEVRASVPERNSAGQALTMLGTLIDVDESQKQDLLLKQEVALNEALFSSLSIALVVQGPDLRFNRVNKAMLQLTGLDEDAFIGKLPSEVPWHRGGRHKSESIRVFGPIPMGQTGAQRFEAQILDSRGQPRDVTFHRTALSLEGFSEPSILNAIVETTDQKSAEKLLIEAQQRLAVELSFTEQLLDAIPVGVSFKDLSLRFKRVNRMMRNAHDLQGRQILGLDTEQAFADRQDLKGVLDRLAAVERQVLQTGVQVEFPVSFTMRDGSVRHAVIQKSLMRDPEGRPVGIIGLLIDMTQRRELEAKLQVSQQELEDQLFFTKELIEVIPNPIYFKGRDGRYIGFNRSWERFFGHRRQDWIGRHVKELFAPAQAEYHDKLDAELYEQGGEQVFEARVRVGGGQWRDTVYSKGLFRKSNGEVSGLIGVITDITERKAAEQELLAAKLAAEQANRAKSDFLANMSHEIRTPMNAIMGMTHLAIQRAEDSVQREQLEIVQSAADGLLSIINDVLDFSKVEAGQMTIESLPFDLPKCLNHVMALFKQRAVEKQLELTLELAPSVDQWVIGDPIRLRQVLINLLGNAVKFTSAGSVVVSVWRSEPTESGPGPLNFEVLDTGCGIPENKLELVFEAFQQADTSTTRQFGGTGLGLTISRRLARGMGGDLIAHSILSQGSRFRLTLPLAPSAAPQSSDAFDDPSAIGTEGRGARLGPTQPMTTPSESSRSLRVLLAEDNRINQKLAIALLERMGHQVVLAHNGLEAIEAYRQQVFDVVLMDIQMPVLGGIEATGEIRRIERALGEHTPIIALTAHAMQGDEERCLLAGMDAFLSKPIDIQKLKSTLDGFSKVVPRPGLGAEQAVDRAGFEQPGNPS